MTSDDGIQDRTPHGRVLMLAPDPTISGPVPGPIGKVAHRLADALRLAGWEVDTELWGRHSRDEGLLGKVTGRARDLLRIRRRLSRGAYDLAFIHTTHDSRALLRDLLLVVPLRQRVAWVVLIHGSHFEKGRPIFDRMARALVARASAVLLLSSEEVAAWRSFYPSGHYRQVANALAPEPPELGRRSAGAPRADECEVLFVGRLIREKGVHELIDAFAALRSRRTCRLTVAGEGPECEALRARVHELGIVEDVEFAGHLDEDGLADLYRRADVLVLPSYSEGLPTVLLEAMSFGLPIVTTRIRGAADHLDDGVNALFVPPRDTEALVRALEDLLDDEPLRAAMASHNVLKARDFSPRKVAEAYAAVFEDVMRERGAL